MTPGSAQPSGVTCPAQGGPSAGSCASPMNSALQGVSSSPHCSQGLADTFLPACLFGIQRGDPKPRLILLYPVREDKPHLAPRAPRAHWCVGRPPGRFHATGSVHLPWREQRAPPSLLDTVPGWRGQHLDRFLCSGWSWTGAGSTRPQCQSMSSGKGESRASSSAQAQGRAGHCPLHSDRAGVARAEGSSQHRRNVLLHGREEITAKECAVPRPGLGGAREKAAGRKNKLLPSQGYSPLVTIFFPSPS